MNKREFMGYLASTAALASGSALASGRKKKRHAAASKHVVKKGPAAAPAPANAMAALMAMPEFAPHGPIPRDFVDPQTGRKVVRLSAGDHSTPLYFNLPAFSPDGGWMVFNRPDGISLTNMNTFEEKSLYTGKLRAFGVSRSKPLVYARQSQVIPNRTLPSDYFSIHLVTGEIKKIATIESGQGVFINSDDSKMFGFIEAPTDFKPKDRDVFTDRYNLKLPMQMFVVDLNTGVRTILLKTTDWVNHLQTSPTDPNLIMYCHEGPWQFVDRIWSMQANGQNNQLLHKRSMDGEAAGHEFFSHDGRQIFYDLQTPKGQLYWLASYDLKTKARVRYSVKSDERSVHFNVSDDGKLFAGDGYGLVDTPKQAIYLYRPEVSTNQDPATLNAPEPYQRGVLNAEPLCHLSGHNYNLVEPNVRFSPDGKWVIFMSNMFGPTHVFAVEAQKT